MNRIKALVLKTAVLLGIALLPEGNLSAIVYRVWSGGGGTNSMNNSANWDVLPVANSNIEFPEQASGFDSSSRDTSAITYGALVFTATGVQYNIQKVGTFGITLTSVENAGTAGVAVPQEFTCKIAPAVTFADNAGTNLSTLSSVTYRVSAVPGALVFAGGSPYSGGTGGAVVVTGPGGVLSTAGAFTIELGSLAADATSVLDFKAGNTLRVGKDNTNTSIDCPICTTAGTTCALDKVGTGTLKLSGTQNYTGTTTVTDGILKLVDNAIAVASDISIVSGKTLELAGPTSGLVANTHVISGIGGLVEVSVPFTGTNFVQLSGANSYTGSTTILTGCALELIDAAIEVPSDITIGNSGFLDLQSNTSSKTYGNALTGSGRLSKSGNSQVILTNPSPSFTGTTALAGGTFTLQNNAITLPSDIALIGSTLSVLEFNATSGGPYTYAHVISDFGGGTHGTVTKSGPINVIFTGDNTYQGNTSVTAGNLKLVDVATDTSTNYVLSSGTILEFNTTASSYTYNNVVSGTGEIDKTGAGQFIMTGANNYTGSTQNKQGGRLTLQDQSAAVPSDILTKSDTFLEFNITSGSRTYANSLNGGKVEKTGSGKLIVTGTSKVDTLNIYAGELNLATGSTITTSVGNPVVVKSAARISGTGILKGAGLTINGGGFVRPGNSPGTLTTDGPFSIFGTYEVQIDGPTNANVSLINITSGTTSLNNSIVSLISLSNFSVNQPYTILTTAGSPLTDTFNPVVNKVAVSAVVSVLLSYDAQNVFLTIERAFLESPALTPNQEAVAEQLDMITNPSPFLEDILRTLSMLPPGELASALDQISGEQYTSGMLMTQELNHQFVRRLYDPLRQLMAVRPNVCECDPCSTFCGGWSLWGDISGGGARIKGNGNAQGLNSNGCEITVGAQASLFSQFTLGIAGSYANTRVRYNVGGTENINTYFGGVYALYRPERFYILADFVYGYNKGNMHRPIQIGADIFLEARSRPQVANATFYGEVGVDFCYCTLGIQPYIAVEVDRIWRKKVQEHHALDFDLTVDKFNNTFTLGSLGIHFTQQVCDFSLGLDLAWIYRFTSFDNRIENTMAAPGTTVFTIDGVPVDKNSIEGTLYIAKKICDGWNVYGELTGQVWSRFASYDALVGVQACW